MQDARMEAADAMRLLIVDDNPGIHRVIKSVVSDLADEIFDCTEGPKALAAYLEYQPDFVLMDFAMAEVDGITATRAITEMDPAANIIIVTNYDGADLREAARLAGARGYVLKEDLFEVRRLLEALLREP
jgi:two-component system chemotaxis response regulator CheY